MNWITIGIGLPFTLIVIVAVFLQAKKYQDVPVYVINLLFSDIIQFCCRIPLDLEGHEFIGRFILSIGLMASVGFMVCISFERYLVVTKPMWYRFRRSIKMSVVVCIAVWALTLLLIVTGYLAAVSWNLNPFTLMICVLLLPLPVLIFFLVGTVKAMSKARSVPADEKRRIVAIQVVVLLIYTLLFLPTIILYLLLNFMIVSLHLMIIASVFLFLSPLADTTLYFLSRKSILDKFLASLCSCKVSNHQEVSSRDRESTIPSTTETD
ncbi:proteinase-activated receptor 2-like [Fundulus heteroclitus]|uniref:proteinase-activated receptor 2-like n=1 Tax=Fundulus heteroclitus TaxID=8078 RepID=UPI00165A5490|nr:proteinase-activated receptor 2-like [Fundulus heteroclitus]